MVYILQVFTISCKNYEYYKYKYIQNKWVILFNCASLVLIILIQGKRSIII